MVVHRVDDGSHPIALFTSGDLTVLSAPSTEWMPDHGVVLQASPANIIFSCSYPGPLGDPQGEPAAWLARVASNSLWELFVDRVWVSGAVSKVFLSLG